MYELEIRCLKTTGETYTFDFLYKPDGAKRAVSYIDTILEGNTRIKRVFFKDGDDKYNNNATYLKQVTTNLGQTKVYYMQGVHLKPGQEYVIKKDYNGNVIYDANGEPARATEDYVIRSFSDQCSIYHRYEFEFKTSLEEDLRRADYQTRYDYWSRLDIRSDSAPVIGGVNYGNYLKSLGGFDISDSRLDLRATSAVNLGRLNHDNYLGVIGKFYVSDKALDLNAESLTVIGGVYHNAIDDFYITDTKLSPMDLGYNKTFDRDYNIIAAGSKGGRYEHYFAPSLIADLKVLEGKFELVNVNTGPALQVITQYGDDVKSTVSVTRTNPLITFHKQNEGNEDYTAREHVYEDHWMNLTHCEELIEPVYSGTSAFIDYNGVNRGPAPGPLHTIGTNTPAKLIGAGGESEIGYYVGGYTQRATDGNPNWNNNNPNNPAIAYFKTCVDGDPVNLQYNTYDVSVFNLRASLTDTLDTPIETATEFHSSLNEDFYGFYVTNTRNEFIGGAHTIGDTYIQGKAFHEGYLPGTNKKIWDYQTTAAVEPTAGFDFTQKEFLISTKETYSYRLYTNQDKYVGVVGSEKLNSIGEFYIYDVRLDLHLGPEPVLTICDVHSEDVLAEVYRGNWNDYNVNKFVEGANYESRSETDIVSWVEINHEPEEKTSSVITETDYEVYELDNVRLYTGNSININDFSILGNKVGLFDSFKDANLEQTALHIQTDEQTLYTYNSFDNSGYIGSIDIGNSIFITGEFNADTVLAEVYRGDWNIQEDFGADLDGVNNFDAITDFRAINIFVENFTEAHETESTNMDIGEYDVFEVHEQRRYVGNAIEIGPDVYVHGYLVPITEESSDTLICDISETSTYEYNTFEMSGSINGFNIGDNFFVTGKLSTTAVKSDIYRAYWTELETGEDIFESFDCGVYRNGVLLSDNNYSRYVA